MMHGNRPFAAGVPAMLLALSGCVSFRWTPDPESLLTVGRETAARRIEQTRRYETRDEGRVLRAGSELLLDLGFTIDHAEDELGVLVASKARSAVELDQVFLAFLLGALTQSDVPYDSTQRLRASVVVQPVGMKSVAVRVTFQRIVWDNSGRICKREALGDRNVYEEFFTKFSKALFLEAHQP